MTDSTPLHPSRRQVLVGVSAGLVVAALPGCGDDGTDASGAPATGDSTAATTEEGSTSAAAGSPQPLVALADVPVGEAVPVTGPDGQELLVAQPEEGAAVAFSAICTHQGCTVRPAGEELRCPCHGSVYAATTGDNLSGPAPRPLEPFPVQVVDGEVVAATT